MRGKGRDQPIINCPPELEDAEVSVPLRGKGRDQLHTESLKSRILTALFPSPCGEKVGINKREYTIKYLIWVTFPSPCGEKVGINDLSYESARDVLDKFPSPCGEKVGIN